MIKTIKQLVENTNAKLYFMGFERLYFFYKNQFRPTASEQAFSLTANQIYGENRRREGISGYYRLYNEADFLRASVESHLPFFDQLILVHDHTCTDQTPAIAQDLAAQYPAKVQTFVYEPEAFKLRSKAYKILPASHPNSFVNYYNFALSKTNKRIVAKVDGDHIAIQSAFAKIADNAHSMDFMDGVFYTFSGLDLWWHNEQIYVNSARIGGIGDHGFHIMLPEQRYYTKGIRTEQGSFANKNRQWKNAGILYFHLKNMRSGIPFHSYRGLDDKVHQQKFKQRKQNVKQHLLDWQTFVTNYRTRCLQKTGTDIAELPDPNVYLKNLTV